MDNVLESVAAIVNQDLDGYGAAVTQTGVLIIWGITNPPGSESPLLLGLTLKDGDLQCGDDQLPSISLAEPGWLKVLSDYCDRKFSASSALSMMARLAGIPRP